MRQKIEPSALWIVVIVIALVAFGVLATYLGGLGRTIEY
jgi:hypothetical protein